MTALQIREDVFRFGEENVHFTVRGRGRPVLLINGLGASLPMWTPLIEDLRDLEVIAFDAPGTGKSSTPILPYRLPYLVGVVTRLLDTLGHDAVDVVGYSLGGVVAQELAHRAPDRVRRMVLAATMCGWGGVPGPFSAYLSIATPIRYYSRRAYELSMPMLGGSPREAEPGFIERTVAMRLASPPSVSGYLLQLAATVGWTSLPWLHTLEHPTLVVSGTADRLAPAANSYLLAAQLPNARLSLFKDWGHLMLMDSSSGVGVSIAEFLSAEELEDSATWGTARTVTSDDLATALRAAKRKLNPASLHHHVVRRMLAPAPPR